jgi:hypothetical protein
MSACQRARGDFNEKAHEIACHQPGASSGPPKPSTLHIAQLVSELRPPKLTQVRVTPKPAGACEAIRHGSKLVQAGETANGNLWPCRLPQL